MKIFNFIRNNFYPRSRRNGSIGIRLSVLYVIALSLRISAIGQPFEVGSISENFTLKDRRSGEEVSLSDFAGHVVVLDFFAYWCAPCAFSSPDIEENIQQHFEELGGNQNGIPVQVLSVNIEAQNPESTDEFIDRSGLDLVLDDPEGLAWNFYNKTNGIPLFVIISGVSDSPSHEQWEVLHNAPSYPGAEFFQELVNSVAASEEKPDPFETAVELGDDWKWIPWFGAFRETDSEWIYHESFGWMVMGTGELNDGQFIYNLGLGWIWTSRPTYPNVYSISRDSWLRYDTTTSEPRVFYDSRLDDTIELFRSELDRGYPFREYNDFDTANSLITEGSVVAGGPPRDGIPAISDPQFISIPEVGYMEDTDILLSVTSGGETRGYPFRILNWHEIVNDQIGDDAFVVTYCPLCGTGVVFDAEVNGRVRKFGVSGLLYQNNLLMYDQESESLWSQFTLQSLVGPMIKTRLKWRPSEQITWKDWKEKYPDGRLLSTETGFTRSYDVDPYSAYFQSGATIFPTTRPIRDDLPIKEWVWGILIDGNAKAYPLSLLADGVSIRDVVDGVEIQLIHDAEALAVSVIEVSTGQPIGNGTGAFWFSWQDFFPETEVYAD